MFAGGGWEPSSVNGHSQRRPDEPGTGRGCCCCRTRGTLWAPGYSWPRDCASRFAASSTNSTTRSGSRRWSKRSRGSRRLALTQDYQMPTLRLDLCGEAEIIVPADEFKSPAALDQGKKLLRKKNFYEDPPFDSHVDAVIIDAEGEKLIVGLGNRINHFGAVAGSDDDAALPHRP